MPAPDILALLDRLDVHGVAVQDAHTSVSYRDLGTTVRALAAALTRHGVSPGDRVAVMVPNCAAAVQLYLACAAIGAIWVGINPASPEAERNRQCALVQPTITVSPENFPTLCDQQFTELDVARPDPSAPCAIGFSSGTTGTPKAFVHNRIGISLAAAALANAHLQSNDRVGVVLPMSIHNLMVVGAMAALFAGATCVAVERMNAFGVAQACRDRQLTMVSALVPTTIYDLVHDDRIGPQSLASLRFAGTGAAGLADNLRSAFEAKFGVRLVGTYGMTEAPGVVCIEDTNEPRLDGACGRPLPHLAVSVSDEHGRALPAGQSGELTVGAADTGSWAELYRPAIGIWNDQGLVCRPPSETTFATGDYGWIDVHGTVHVTGRKADVIVRGGVNVNAAEVESVLGQLPAIRDIAVIAEPDDRLGQRIVAHVESAPGIRIDGAQLRRQARDVLAHGKVPDEFIVCALPRNAMGKVARGQLKRP